MQRLHFLKEDIKDFFMFIKWLPAYFRLHRNYGYQPDTYSFIIENYEMVLTERTNTMSKPTYCWQDVVGEIDKWYEEVDAYEEIYNGTGLAQLL